MATMIERQPEGWQWMTPEIRRLLDAIPGPHEVKKRRTVILLASAYASSEPVAPIFERADTCAGQIWWTKWQHISEVDQALEACKAAARDWVDLETVSIEEQRRRERRRAIADYSAKAPAALAAVMAGQDQKGADRINAAVTLINLAEGVGVNPVAGASETKIGDKDGLTIRVVYDDADHSPAEAAQGAGGNPG